MITSKKHLPTPDSFLDKKISLKKNQNRNNMLGKSPTLNAWAVIFKKR